MHSRAGEGVCVYACVLDRHPRRQASRPADVDFGPGHAMRHAPGCLMLPEKDLLTSDVGTHLAQKCPEGVGPRAISCEAQHERMHGILASPASLVQQLIIGSIEGRSVQVLGVPAGGFAKQLKMERMGIVDYVSRLMLRPNRA